MRPAAAAVTTSSSLPGRGFDLTAAVKASSVPAAGLMKIPSGFSGNRLLFGLISVD